MNSFDTSILMFLNQFAQRSPRFDEFVTFLSDCNLLKGGIIVGLIWWLWFDTEDVRRKREVLLAALIASVPALILAKTLTVVTFRTRPLNEARLAFHVPHYVTPADWKQLSSFPSDHAVLFFAMPLEYLLPQGAPDGSPFFMSQPSFACHECIWESTTPPTFLLARPLALFRSVWRICLASANL
jgi:hypothetical protein